MGLLGGVDQNEEGGEGAGREARRLRGERARAREQRLQVRRPGHAQASGTARPAQLLHRAQDVLTGQTADHPAQRSRQPAHVLAQRRVQRAGDRRRQRNGGGGAGGGGGHGRGFARQIPGGGGR